MKLARASVRSPTTIMRMEPTRAPRKKPTSPLRHVCVCPRGSGQIHQCIMRQERRPAPVYHRDERDSARSVGLGAVLVVSTVLFIIFFLIGFLGPFSLGGR